MSQLQTREEREVTIFQQLGSPKFHEQMALAAPRDVDPARIARIVTTCVRESRQLAECQPQSLLAAAMICAQTGLEPGPIGHAAIVPYKGKAQWQAMYKGFLHLMYRSEMVASVSAGVVYEADDFDYNEGSGAFVKHKRALVKDRGERIAAYACVELKDGGTIVRVAGIDEIHDIRKRYSKTKRDDSAWVTEFDEMACKTMLKRAAKWAPISPEAKVAIGYDDLADTGKPQPTGITEKDVTDLGTDETKLKQERPPADAPPDQHCNKPVGNDGLVCGFVPDHQGPCAP